MRSGLEGDMLLRMNNIIKPAAEHSKWEPASSDLSVSINKIAHYAGLERPEIRRWFSWGFFPL